MSTSPLSTSSMFAGSSRFSNDFKQVIDRSVAIASLPLTQLQTNLSTLLGQSTELSTLNSKLSSVQTALQSVASATGTGSYTTTLSDGNVSTSIGTGVMAGTYTVEVDDLGSYNNTLSKDALNKVTDPAAGNISSQTNFTLSVGSESFSFTATNLNDMAKQINGSGLNVQASIVNVGSPSAPDYRLSVQGTKLAASGISLTDDATPTPNQLLSTLADGSPAQYKVNGYATAATADSRTVEIAPGLNVTLAYVTGTGKPATTITVGRAADSVKNALTSFITAYNAAVDELDTNRGSEKGALKGDSIVSTVSGVLSSLQGYSGGGGAINSLGDIGITVDKTGKLSLDSTVFSNAAQNNPYELMTFLGDTSTGGFLKAANDTMTSLTDSTSGYVQDAILSVTSQISSQNDRISQEQDRIDNLRTSLNAQMASADAAIAALEQQASYISSMFAAMETANASYSK